MKIKIDNTPYDIPTNYSQVKYLDFAHSKTPGLPLEKKLSYQTTIPPEIITGLPWSAVSKLIEAVSFYDDLPEYFEPYESDLTLGNEHYIKLEQSRRALAQCENRWLGVIEVVQTYTGIDISDMPVTKAYGCAIFFLNSLNSSSHATNVSVNMNPTKTS